MAAQELAIRIRAEERATQTLQRISQSLSRLRAPPPLTVAVQDRASQALERVGALAQKITGPLAPIVASAKDAASPVLNRISSAIAPIAGRVAQITATARDAATPVLSRVGALVGGLSGRVAQIVTTARDAASPVLARVSAQVGALAGRTAEVIIKARDQASRTLGNVASGLGRIAFRAGAVLAPLAAIGGAFIGLRSAANLEQVQLTFETLLGSAGAAKQRVQELVTFAARTPFQLPGIIEADRLLQTFGTRSIENLKLVGDAAAGVNVGIEEVAFWFGRAATAIQSGRPFGEAAQRLQELGLLSGPTRNELERLVEAGADSAQIMGVLQGELGRFGGLMEKQSTTVNGLVSTFKDNFTLLLAAFAQPFLPVIKKGLGAAIAFIGKPSVQGVLVRFATQGARALERFFRVISVQGPLFVRTVLGLVRGTADMRRELFVLGPGLATAALAIQGFVRTMETIVRVVASVLSPIIDLGTAVLGLLSPFRDSENAMLQMQGKAQELGTVIGVFLAVFATTALVSFTVSLAGLALGFVAFPVLKIIEGAKAVASFVSATAGLVSKAVTITQRVITTGAEILSGLASITQSIIQNVRRTGAKPITDFAPKTQTVTQDVKVKIPLVDTGKAGKAAGRGFSEGFIGDVVAFIMGRAIAAWLQVDKLANIFIAPILKSAMAKALQRIAWRAVLTPAGRAFGGAFGILVTESVLGGINLARGDIASGLIRILLPTLLAGIGALIGSVVPGLGTAGGALAGAFVGAILAELIIAFPSQIGHFFTKIVPQLFKEWIPFGLGVAAAAILFGLPLLGIAMFRGLQAYVFPHIVTFFSRTIPNFITQQIPALAGAGFRLITGAFGAMGTWLLQTVLPGVTNFFTHTLPSEILGGLPHVRAAARRLAFDVFPALGGWIKDAALPAVGTFFSRTLPDAIVSFFLDALPRTARFMADIGRAIWNAILSGLQAGLGVFDPIADFFQGFWDKFKEGFDWWLGKLRIRSPSKLFMEVGHDLIAGLTMGMEKAGPQVRMQLARLASTVEGGLRDISSIGAPAGQSFAQMFNLPPDISHAALLRFRRQRAEELQVRQPALVPALAAPAGGGNSFTFNFTGPFMGNEFESRRFAEQIMDAVRRNERGR